MKKIFTAALILMTNLVFAQVPMTTSGSYSQDFNTLATSGTTNSWSDNSTIANWYSQRTGSGTNYAADAGNATGGNLYSYGTGTNTDRALGSIGSGNAAAGHFAHGVLLRNTSGTTITDIKVSYTLEQWRNAAKTTSDTITFWYKTSSSAISVLNPNSNATWTKVAGLSLGSPTNTLTSGALDGNATANKSSLANIAIPGLSLADNEFIILKWEDTNHLGNDHGLAIDDITISWTVGSSSTPTLLSTTLNTFGSVCVGTTSTANSFTLNGTNLNTNDIIIGPLPGYTFSTSASGTYSGTLTIPQSGGTLPSTDIFVIFSPTAVQSYGGNIPVSGGGTSSAINVVVSGSGVNPASATTGSPSSITSTGATLAGSISLNCGATATAYGIKYSTTNGFDPTTSGTDVNGTNLASNSFSVNLTGLTASTPYFYVAYVTTSGGTVYGTQSTFTTGSGSTPSVTGVVISQVYGGAGGAGATYNADYVELHNNSSTSQDISGYKIMYGSAGGNLGSGSTNIFTFPLAGVVIPAGGYLLVAQTTSNLPVTADHNFTWSLGGVNGKVVFGTDALLANTPLSGQPVGAVLDFVGYGTAAESEGTALGQLSVTTAAIRNNNGCDDTNNNNADFTIGAPAPRNSSSPAVLCVSTPTLNATSLASFGSVCLSVSSDTNSFVLRGANLTTADIVVGPFADYSFSTIRTGTYASSITISQTGGTLADTTIYVKLTPTAAQSYDGNISVSGGGVTTAINVAATGTGISSVTPTFTQVPDVCSGVNFTLPATSNNGITGNWTPPIDNTATTTYTFTPTSVSCATTATMTVNVITTPSATPTTGTASPVSSRTATLSGTISLTCATATAYGFEYSTTSGFLNGSGTTVNGSNLNSSNAYSFDLTGLTPSTNYYFKAFVTAGGSTQYGAEQTFTTTAVVPTLSATTLSPFGSVCVNTTSTTKSFVLRGTDLTTADIVVGPLTGYSFSTNSTGTFTPSITITQTGGTLADTTIYVQLTPTAAQSYDGVILVSGGGDPTPPNVAATGSGLAPTTPTFNPVPDVCSGGSINLPATSNNSITGTWNPPTNNTATTPYTFTPTAGQCATTATMTVNVITTSSATATTGASSAITSTGATLAGSVTLTCATPTAYGIEYSSTSGFTPGTGTVVNGTNISGSSYSVSVTGLTASTTYYYVAFVTTSSGTVYGTQSSFTTSGSTVITGPAVVISQVYGGGGSTGAPYNTDYVELHNRTNTAQSLSGLSVQYGSASSSSGTISWSSIITLPVATIPAGGYYLIQTKTPTSGAAGISLPTPDFSFASMDLSATNGRLALVNGTTLLPTGCPASGQYIDMVGYGSGSTICSETSPMTALSATLAGFRNNSGCDDTDNNSADFSTAAPAPRNSSSPAVVCSSVPSGPTLNATNLANFGSVLVGISIPGTFTLTGLNLTGAPGSITLTSSSSAFLLSIDGTTWTSSITVPYTSATLSSTTINVQFTPTAVGSATSTITINGGGASDITVTATGTGTNTAPAPSLQVTTFTTPPLNFGSICAFATIGPDSFKIVGRYLNSDPVLVNSLNGFGYSTNFNGPFSASLSLSHATSSLDTVIYVMFMPNAEAVFDNSISITGGGAGATFVAVTGTGTRSVGEALTGDSSMITSDRATLSGTIISNGCFDVTEYGVEVSGITGFVNGTGTRYPANNLNAGSFQSMVTGLTQNTPYYYKAYVKNNGGYGYGQEKLFITQPIGAGLSLYAMPFVRGQMVHFSLSGINPGHYALKMFNSRGQLAFQYEIIAPNGIIDEQFRLPASLSAGIYSFQIASPTFRIVKSVLVN